MPGATGMPETCSLEQRGAKLKQRSAPILGGSSTLVGTVDCHLHQGSHAAEHSSTPSDMHVDDL